MWNILDTGKASAEDNMLCDSRLLEGLKPGDPAILHLYDWMEDSATYGYFIKPAEYLDLNAVKKRGLKLARRPTGGGIVFHTWDLAFSVVVPADHRNFSGNTLDNYRFVNDAVMATVKHFLSPKAGLDLIPNDAPALDGKCARFCMARPTQYDVVLEGRKIAGAAQRKRKEGFLHQGTISLVMPSEEYLREVLLPGNRVLEAIKSATYPLLQGETTLIQRNEAKAELQRLLFKHLSDGNR
jgi:lipoate-protein ligase A